VGVSIFFVLSGLLVGRPFVRAVLNNTDGAQLGSYVRRRLSRIYPVYLFVLAVVVVTAVSQNWTWPELVADALLVHIYRPEWAIGPISQSWTLATELAFYALVPAWFWGIRTISRRRSLTRVGRNRLIIAGLLCWVLLSLIWRLAVLKLTPQYVFGEPGLVDVRGALLTWLPNYLDTFAVGIGLAVMLENGSGPIALWRRLVLYALGGFSLWYASTQLGLTSAFSGFDTRQTLLRHAFFVCSAACVVGPSALAMSGAATRSRSTSDSGRVIRKMLGGAALGSYGVYLWHQWVTTEWFAALKWTEFAAPFPTALFAVVAGSAALAGVTYWLVERPAELLTTDRGGSPGRAPRHLGAVSALDGLRGLSILAVLGTHVIFLDGGNDRWSLRGGFLGVDVFLALSGFLIASVLVREVDVSGTVDGPSFALRRARRLLPPLIAFLAIEGIVAVTLIGTSLGEQGLQSLLALTFTSNWQLSLGHQPPFELVHLWSLALEGQFYVLMAVGVWAARKRLMRPDRLLAWCVMGAAAVVIWRLWLLRSGVSLPALYERTDARADSMFMGVAAALVWRSRLLPDSTIRRIGAVALVALGVCWVVAEPSSTWLYRGGFTVLAAAAAAAVAAAATGSGVVARLGELRVLRWVGMISFSLYLWHLPIYLWVVELIPDAPLGVKALIAVPMSILAGWLGFIAIERRALASWRHSTGGRSQGTTSVFQGTSNEVASAPSDLHEP